MKRALPSVSVLVLLGCRGEFDIDKYLIADTESGDETTLGESGSGSEDSDGESSESESSETTSEATTDATESESTDTDVTCEPGQLDIGSACIVTEQVLEIGMNIPSDIALGDFTSDGLIDLLIAGTQVTVRPGNLSGQFGAAIPITGASGAALAAADLDVDGRLDFAVISDNQIQMFIQSGGGAFIPGTTLSAGGYDGVFGDIDGDLDEDLVVSGANLRTFTMMGGGAWAFGIEFMYSGQGLTMAEFNDDGHRDIALAMTASSVVGLFANDGMGVFQPPAQFFVTSVTDVAAIDIEVDDQFGLVASNRDDDNLSVFLIQNGEITELELHAVGDAPKAVAVGDIDGDGLADVAVANSGSHDVSILLGIGSGLTDEFRTLDSDPADQPEAIEIRDLDGDGLGEIVVGMLGSNRVIVYGNAG